MLAKLQLTRSGSLWTDRDFRQQFARVEIELKAVEMTAMRLLDSDKHREKGKPNPMSSVLKIKGAETQQRSAELMLKAAGPHAIAAKWEDRNILAKTVLGL